jgi:hypothetical protein
MWKRRLGYRNGMWTRFISLAIKPHDKLLWRRWINLPFLHDSVTFVVSNYFFLETQLIEMACKSGKKHMRVWFWDSCVSIDLVWAALLSCNNCDGQISAFQSSLNESAACSHLIPSAGNWQAWLRESGEGDDFIIMSYVVSLIVFQHNILKYKNGAVN